MPDPGPDLLKFLPSAPAANGAPAPTTSVAPSSGQEPVSDLPPFKPNAAATSAVATPPTAPAVQTPDIASGMIQSGLEGLTFGAGDKLAGWVDALYDTYLGNNTLAGKTLSEKAAKQAEMYRAQSDAFTKAHPYLADIGYYGGMGVGGLGLGELGLGATAGGAVAGAAEGYGSAPEDSSLAGTIARTALGAAEGAGGGYLGGKFFGSLADPAAAAAAARAAGPIAGPLVKGAGSGAIGLALHHAGVPFLGELMGLEARKPIMKGLWNLGGLVRNLPSAPEMGGLTGGMTAQEGTDPSELAKALILGYGVRELF